MQAECCVLCAICCSVALCCVVLCCVVLYALCCVVLCCVVCAARLPHREELHAERVAGVLLFAVGVLPRELVADAEGTRRADVFPCEAVECEVHSKHSAHGRAGVCGRVCACVRASARNSMSAYEKVREAGAQPPLP